MSNNLDAPLPKAATRGDCDGNQDKCNADGCPIFGRLLVRKFSDDRVRVKGCGDPSARGRRNKTKGQRKQAKAVTLLGIPRSALHPGHEEFLGGAVLTEVKAGGQVSPVATQYRKAREQSDRNRAIGDVRPFVFIAMPDGETDGIAAVRLSDLGAFVQAINDMWKAS